MHRIAAPAESVRQKIRSLTSQIEQVQQEICTELALENSSSQRIRIDASDDLKHLRAALDQLRRVLWFYFEEITIAETAEHLVPQAIARTEIEPPPSFFDRLNLVIEGYMQTRTGFEALKRKSPATESWKGDGRGWQSSIRSRTPTG